MLTPIRDGEGDHYAREFFRPEFIAQRLGKPGQWQGGLADKLRLENPVAPRAFADLLQGRTPEGDDWVRRPQVKEARVQGWRFTFTEPGDLSFLYGLSPEVARGGIRLVHNEGVRAALKDFEQSLSGRTWFQNFVAPPEKRTLFAKFQSGASREQQPQLETTVFLFNLIYRRGGGVESYQPEQLVPLHDRMQAIYQQTLQKEAVRFLGSRVELPNELQLRMQAAMSAKPANPRHSLRADPLQGRQLFAAWQAQARNLGWGSEKTIAALREAKLSPTWQNWMESWSRKFRYEAVQGHHSPVKCFVGSLNGKQKREPAKQEQGRQAQQPQSANKPEQKQPGQDKQGPEKWTGYMH